MNVGRIRYSYTPCDDQGPPLPPPPPPPSHTAPRTMAVYSAPSAKAEEDDDQTKKKMILYGGLGILFVVVVDAIVRLVTSKNSGTPQYPAGSLMIDGKMYIPM